jgi:hypothetical protein
MESWRFVDDPRSKAWSWQLVDDDTSSVRKCSDRNFPTLQACIEDAIAHGYVARHGAGRFSDSHRKA